MDTFTSKDGTRIAYQHTGAGPALILVHGASDDHTSWAPMVPFLTQHYTVYAMDRRGRGGSQVEGKYAVQREFEDIARLVDLIHERAPNRPIHLFGYSFGGYCCLNAALLTDHIDNLIIFEPPPMGNPEALPPGLTQQLQQLYDLGDHEGMLSVFFQDLVGVSAKELAVLRSKPSWPDRVAAAHTILREIKLTITQPRFDPTRYQDITLRTLLLVGSESPPNAWSRVREIHDALPNSQIVTLPTQDHMAIDHKPKAIADHVLAFLLEST
jgi:pimeloyl-ACP methyl ester carboxylesterase